MEKSFLKYWLPNILFNTFEFVVIFVVGILFGIKAEHILAILIAFVLNKVIFGHSLHYKAWYLCLIWTILLFSSYYLLAKVNMTLAVFSTVGFVFLSNISNIKDLENLFFWGGNKLNNNVYDWVKFNQDNKKLKQYEENLKLTDRKKYFIFIYRYREFKSYSDIAKIMDIDIQRICDEINIMSHFIEYSIRLGEE